MDSVRCNIGGEFIIIGGSVDLRQKKTFKRTFKLSLSLSLTKGES